MSAESEFVERLQKLIESCGSLSAFARKIGRSEGGVRRWLVGAEVKRTDLVQISQSMNVSITWLCTGLGLAFDIADQFVEIPEYNVVVAAGSGAWNDSEHIVGYKYFEKRWLKKRGIEKKDAFLLRVRGDSQEPLLWNGDLILVNGAVYDTYTSGQPYVILINDELVVKFMQKLPSGNLLLSSKNPDYPPFEVNPNEENVKIVGCLVNSSHDWLHASQTKK